MGDWLTFVNLGLDHILSWDAYDHLLFITTICAIFRPSDWRALLVLITAFTIGHSVTLMLAAIWGSALPSTMTEWLVALSIFMGGIFNLSRSNDWHAKHRLVAYLMALSFGLIHGLAFSGFFQAMAFSESDLVTPLLGFNIGVEAGQLIVVAVIMALAYLVIDRLGLKFRHWTVILSVLTSAGGAYLVIERWPW